ncbi:uncharacterized protein LOC135483041 [Lineus longissimus]|uniref:uncharacterized protein LOC135483041 n=1 Tax=Lineus longissimus TaxID=88925 RepID=UPI002B4FAAAA
MEETSRVPTEPIFRPMAQETDDISYFFFIWVIPVVVGIPGNALAIIVANRKHNRQLSPCVYMTAMGVADTVLLLERIMAIVLNKVLLAHGFVTEPLWWFRIQVYILYTSSILSGLFLAGMSVDRLIAVRFPMDAQRLCTTSRARTTVVMMFLSIAVLNGHLFYVLQYFYDKQLGIYAILILAPDPELEILEGISTSFQLVVGTILPFFIIFTCNILIIITLKQASKARQRLETNQKNVELKSQHLTRMLLFVSFAYVITTLPYRLYHLTMKIPVVANLYDLRVLYWRKQYVISVWSLIIVWMFNYSLNFYLYCIGGGRKYRDDAKLVLSRLFRLR